MNHPVKELTEKYRNEFLEILKNRFETNMYRHAQIEWSDVYQKLISQPEKIYSLAQMEQTGGEPDVVILNQESNEIVFYDCVLESPKGRRSFCYDQNALKSRKDHLPQNTVMDCTDQMSVELLTEQEYRALQKVFNFDLKTSSWVVTPESIRELGGAIFCDYRYGQIFTYHNGAQSYYSSRGFRAKLII